VLLRILLICLIFITPLLAGNEKISRSLESTLRITPANETVKVWIFFKDKGENVNFKAIENKLTAKSKVRRSKIFGESLVDFYDVPVNRNYLKDLSPYLYKTVVKSKWLNAVSAFIYPDNIEQITKKDFIKKIDIVNRYKSVEPIESLQKLTYQQPENINTFDYGDSYTQNSQIHVPEVHDLGIDGSGVLICMLDAGFNNLEHDAFAQMNILQTWDFVNGDSIVDDQAGQMGTGDHGTNTLSTIGGFYEGELIGPAFGADFILAKTENTDWERHIEEDHWVAGAEWADSLGADVISSSLGYRDGFTNGEPDYTWQDMDGNTAICTIGADIAASRGIVVVNSAGNSGDGTYNTLGAPSDGDSVIAVAAVSSSGTRVSFSSVGPSADGRIKPDVAAMGSGVIVASSWNTSGYGTSSGTSFSCPLTAGVAALVLSANPSLTPMQVRDALRETASQSNSPDKYLGWGIVHAYDAVFYFSANLSHDPLSDTENINGPYDIVAQVSSRIPLASGEIKLIYGTDSSFGNEIVMQPTANPDEYSAQISGIGAASEYYYYIQAKNNQQVTTKLPFNAPADYFRFYAGPDTVMPVISHHSLNNQALIRWPAEVRAQISDNQGIDSAWVEFQINSGMSQSFELFNTTGNSFSNQFPIDSSSLNVGDIIEYKISARDYSTAGNISVLPVNGYYSFEILDVMGVVVVIDDDQGKEFTKPGKKGYSRQIESIGSAASRFESVLISLGYLVDKVNSATMDTSAFSHYDLIISSSGEDQSPVSSAAHREKLENWVLSNPNHKLLIEGGEIGYDAISSPGYPSFASNVLHINDWLGDQEGNLVLKSNQATHAIATIPNQMPANISLNYVDWGDEDAVAETADAYSVFGVANDASASSIVVYDDNQNAASAQIIYFSFNINAVSDTNVANHLIENAITYLMNQEVTNISLEDNTIPENLTLLQNYPNPFNPQTTIKYALPINANVEFSVFNLLGQQIVTKRMGSQKSGWHTYNFDASNLSSGVYFYRLQSEEASGKIMTQTKKMLYIQ